MKLSRPLSVPHDLDLPSYLFDSCDDSTHVRGQDEELEVRKHYIPLASSRMNCPIGLPTGTDPITGKNNKRTMTVRCENVPVAPLEAITVEKR